MRIAIVAGDSDLWRRREAAPAARVGGEARVVWGAAQALAAAGDEVTIYLRRDFAGPAVDGMHQTAREGGRRQRPERSPTAVFIGVGPQVRLAEDDALRHASDVGHALSDVWSGEPPEVVHAHGWIPGMAAHVGAAQLGIPVVQTFYSMAATNARRRTSPDDVLRPRLERSLALSAAQVIAPSTEAVFLLSRMGVPQRRSTVIPPGVDTDEFARNGSTEVRDPDLFRVLIVDSLDRPVDIERALGAISLLRDTEVVIVGGPGPREAADHFGARRVRDAAVRLGMAHRVHLRGPVDHSMMPAIYRSADVVVSLPDGPGTPLHALEAMAVGRPVVAAAAGGLIDLVIDGITGLHVAPRDVLSIAEALRKLRNDPVLRDSMGLAASDRARTRYPWPRIAAEMRRIYASVAQQPPVEVDAR